MSDDDEAAKHQQRNDETVRRLTEHLRQLEFRVLPATRREVRRMIGMDPVTDLGITEATFVDAEAIVLVSRATSPVRTANSHLERCALCDHEVWVAATTPPEPKRVCLVCFGQDVGIDFDGR